MAAPLSTPIMIMFAMGTSTIARGLYLGDSKIVLFGSLLTSGALLEHLNEAQAPWVQAVLTAKVMHGLFTKHHATIPKMDSSRIVKQWSDFVLGKITLSPADASKLRNEMNALPLEMKTYFAENPLDSTKTCATWAQTGHLSPIHKNAIKIGFIILVLLIMKSGYETYPEQVAVD